MTPEQTALVVQRARLIRLWPLVGGLMALAVIGLFVFACKHLPIDTEPAALAAKVQSGQIDMEGMARMAIVGSVGFIACGGLLLTVFVVITFSLFNEKRLIVILKAQETELEGLRVALGLKTGEADDGEDDAPPEPAADDV